MRQPTWRVAASGAPRSRVPAATPTSRSSAASAAGHAGRQRKATMSAVSARASARKSQSLASLATAMLRGQSLAIFRCMTCVFEVELSVECEVQLIELVKNQVTLALQFVSSAKHAFVLIQLSARTLPLLYLLQMQCVTIEVYFITM